MLSDLKKVEDDLYEPETLKQFLQAHPMLEALKLLNKTQKKETQTRLEYLFSRIGRSNDFYLGFLELCLEKDPGVQQEFRKYVMSDRSEAYFNMLFKHPVETLKILEHHPKIGEGFYTMLSGANGLKMIKIMNNFYKDFGSHDCLYTPEIHEVLKKGINHENSEVKMRYVEVVANISTDTRGFNFIEKDGQQSMLDKLLEIYTTEDILLKMNIVQIVSVLGEGAESSKLLYQNKVWKQVQQEATDNNQEFYIRKALLALLIDMSGQGHVELTPKVKTGIAKFIQQNINQKGQYVEAALELIAHCFHSMQTTKVVIGTLKIFEKYCLLGRTTEDRLKVPYLDSLVNLTALTKPGVSKSLIINILNCIGNPNLCTATSHNIHANNHMIVGLVAFAKWFVDFIQQPFEDYELRLLTMLSSLTDYFDVSLELFKDDRITKYLIKKVSNIDNKVLKDRKAAVIRKIILKGDNEWKGLQLEAYSHILEKEIKGTAKEVEYATNTEG